MRTLNEETLKILKLLVTIGLFALLFWFIPLAKTGQVILTVAIPWLFIAVGIMFIGILVSSLKLQELARLSFDEMDFFIVLRAYYIGIFFNNFLPAGVGGDVMKINQLRKTELTTKQSSASVVVERGTGLIAVIILALAFAIFWPGFLGTLGLSFSQYLLVIGIPLAAISAVPIYWSWNSLVKPFLKQRKDHNLWGKIYSVLESFFVYRNNLFILFKALFYSFMYHSLNALTLYVLSYSLGHRLNFLYVLGVIPFIAIIDIIPISIGSLGVREGAITYCLSRIGLSPAEALSLAILFRITYYFHSAIGGILYGFSGKLKVLSDG